MITPEQAIKASRIYSDRNKTGWSESDLVVSEIRIEGQECYIIQTATADLEGKSWMEFDTTTPVKFYVHKDTGKCFGHEYGSRGLITGS